MGPPVESAPRLRAVGLGRGRRAAGVSGRDVPGRQSDPEPVLSSIEDTTGRVVTTLAGAHDVLLGTENVLNHDMQRAGEG